MKANHSPPLSPSDSKKLVMQHRLQININQEGQHHTLVLTLHNTLSAMTQEQKETLRWIVNLLASILTALAAALGTSACVAMI